MCTSLSDLFACIRAPASPEADTTSTTHQRNEVNVDDETPDPRRDQPKQQQVLCHRQVMPVAQGLQPLPLPSSWTSSIQPSPENLHVSYETLERYDQIFGRPDQVPGPFGSVRNIPDQF
ncbi:uncharacterized protein LOC108105476 [Drosophila eugracilis]|uniref:uncharacterized protein LOC108105476 n=1 Tax=Drosophila eugracilis TaxID=29029 RepID=UPI0007E892F0|nr:uncharacterized protein LOC108105476 [Drosophila eugracilis]